MKHLSFPRLLAITAFGFALTMLSNTLEPAVLGRKVLELAPNNPNTALGFTTFAGLIVAILVQPIVGVLSDRTRSRWGRRLPYFAVGVVMVALCLVLIALAPDFGFVVIGVLLIQLSSNTIQGPWQALIPDHVPEAQRGRASGIKATSDILAFIVGRLVAGQLVGRYAEWGEAAVVAAVSVPIVVFVIALAVTALAARESPEAANAAPTRTIRQALSSAFSIDLRAHPAFGWWFANRFLFWGAFIALNTFLLFFVISVVGLSESQAQGYIGQISTVLGAALALVSVPAGWIADRVGRKPVVIAAGIVAALGTGSILFVRDLNLITLAALVVGLGIGAFLSANWALVTDIVPRAEAARYLGIANIATAGGSAIARFMGGAMIDSLNAATGSTSAGYLALYGVATLFFLLSALVVIPLPSPARKTNAAPVSES
jgi:MFS family permease